MIIWNIPTYIQDCRIISHLLSGMHIQVLGTASLGCFFFNGYRLVIKHGQLENPIHIEMSCFLTMCMLCMWNILKWK